MRVRRIISLLLAVVMVMTMSSGTSSVTAAGKAKLVTKKLVLEKGTKKKIVIKKKNKKYSYKFTSSNKKVAKVNKKGQVTAKKVGKAKITVREISKGKKIKLGVVKVTVKNVGEVPDKDDIKDETPGPGESGKPSGPTQVPSPTAIPTPSPEPTISIDIDFSENDLKRFSPEGDGVKLEINKNGYNDDYCLMATGRNQRNDWFGCGPAIDITDVIKPGKTYKIACYVRCDNNATITLRSINGSGGGWGNWPSQVGNTVEVTAGQWKYMEATYASPDTINANSKIRLYWDANNTSNMYIDSITFIESSVIDPTFKTLFTDIFENIGTCNTYSQMKNNKGFTTTLYNSVTMENETKPSSFLNEGNVSNSVPAGYIVPPSYKDNRYPVLNFETFDNVIQTAYEYGLKIRFHVLIWHSQTPGFFFRQGYSRDNGYVSKDVMNGRMEYYIRNVVNHIYNTPHGKDVVYALDVVNEYFHNYDKGRKSNWNSIYYPQETSESNRTNKPEYVKKAFEITYDELSNLGLAGKVKLFYNDYNTYEVTNDIITMINYVNEDKKVCDGVGMQCHLDVGYPTSGMGGMIARTIDAFAAEGFEIQITELDVTDYNNSGKQSQYYTDFFNMLVTKKKNGVNITGVTFWGLCDTNSWRRDGKPLLFSAVFSPKPVFYEVIETAKKAWE